MSEAADEAQLLAALGRSFPAPPDRLGVAVSGGGDSIALLHLATRVFPEKVWAVTVDHGLRPESADEARGVAAFCAGLGVPHQTLRWSGPKASGNLMDQARQARLQLMAQWAQGYGISDILLGHTADDQAESFLMNLGRAAGVEGLCGMRRAWEAHGLRWHRPLLEASRASLRRYLTAKGVGWVEDPSNDNPRFTRVKARKAMAALAGLGITADTLGETVRHLQAARSALWATLAGFAERHVTDEAGAVRLPQGAFLDLPPDLRRLLLQATLRWMSGGEHASAAPALARFQAAAAAGQPATLGGTRLFCRASALHLVREPRAVEGPVPFGATWDHRWRLQGPSLAGLSVAALGAAGLAQCPDWRRHGPREALIVTPALWQDGRLIAAPCAGLALDWQAELQPRLNQFILSH